MPSVPDTPNDEPYTNPETARLELAHERGTWHNLATAARTRSICGDCAFSGLQINTMTICQKVEVTTSHGPVTFDYVISTPRDTSAKTIDPQLPTVLLLHAAFYGKEVFHYQFADSGLRRFNLVAVDLLFWGDTEGAVPDDYDQKMAAADIVDFMDAIHLPPCVFAGLGMGAMFAMQLVVLFPERVKSLFLVSPLCTPELPVVAAGRTQILDLWAASFDSRSSGDLVDREALEDATFGGSQLCFNSHETSFVRAMIAIAIPQSTRRQAFQPAGCLRAGCTILIERTGYSDAELEPLARSRVPVALVHGSEDIAYPADYYAQFSEQLMRSGVNVRIHEIEGAPHLPSATHYEKVNPLLAEFVLDSWDGERPQTCATEVTSPFDARLREAGWRDSREEEDSDIEM